MDHHGTPGSPRATVTGPAVLAVRLPNWVGDVCMALPALSLLVDHGFTLHGFGRAWAADLLAGLPFSVRQLPRGIVAGARALRATRAPRGLLLTNSLSSALQLRLAGIGAIGYRRDLRSILLARGIDRPPGLHEVESFWHLAQAALVEHGGRPTDAPVPFVQLPLVERHRSAARAALAGARVGARYSVLCPLAIGAASGRSKVWPHFAALCRRLIDQGDSVVACPGLDEARQCAAVLPGAMLLDGVGLGAYAAIMARATRVIANDSGPLHLAAAVGVPVLGIFGPTSPARTRPWSERGAAVGGDGKWPDLDEVRDAVARLPAADSARA